MPFVVPPIVSWHLRFARDSATGRLTVYSQQLRFMRSMFNACSYRQLCFYDNFPLNPGLATNYMYLLSRSIILWSQENSHMLKHCNPDQKSLPYPCHVHIARGRKRLLLLHSLLPDKWLAMTVTQKRRRRSKGLNHGSKIFWPLRKFFARPSLGGISPF